MTTLQNSFLPSYYNHREFFLYAMFSCVAGLALLIAAMFHLGGRILLLAAVASLSGIVVEHVVAHVRGKAPTGFAAINGILLALLVPADLPLSMMAVAAIVSTLFAKEAFGGPTTAVFCPVLIAKAFLMVSYPAYNSGDTCGHLATASSTFQTVIFWLLLACIILSTILRPQSVLMTIGLALGACLILTCCIGLDKIAQVSKLKDCIDNNTFNLQTFLLLDNFLLTAVLFSVNPANLPRHWFGKLLLGIIVGICAVLMRAFSRYSNAMVFALLVGNCIAPTLDMLFALKKKPAADGAKEVAA